jgi:glucose-1-phosphate cytidylyltransferase
MDINMKVVLLAGGFGTRISEESELKPKPMIEIGGRPILWHIMKIFSHYGYNDFIICCGYKGYYIKDYFHHYYMHQTDVTIDIATNEMQFHKSQSESWKITLVDTGLNTMTGGRIKRVKQYVGDETFMLTYGDGVSDVNIGKLVEYHKKNNSLATLTAIQPSGRFGGLDISGDGNVVNFIEKPKGEGGWINGGFFVLEPKIIDYINDDATIWEKEPLENLTKDGQLSAYKHEGFWQPMDTLRDKMHLEKLWKSDNAPWKIW